MTIENKVTSKTLKQLEKISGQHLTLGKLIWALREGEEETQVNFAVKLGVSKQYLCDLEHDRKSVSPSLAASYAEKLGYSREQFIRLSLQDLLDREGLDVRVEITPRYAHART